MALGGISGRFRMPEWIQDLTGSGGAAVTRKDVRAETAKGGRPQPFIFSFKPQTKAFQLRLRFNKSRVDKGEIIEALENILKELRAAK